MKPALKLKEYLNFFFFFAAFLMSEWQCLQRLAPATIVSLQKGHLADCLTRVIVAMNYQSLFRQQKIVSLVVVRGVRPRAPR